MTFLAPPNFNLNQIVAAGSAGGLGYSAANSAVGHYGTFDLQRSRDSAGNTTFYIQYQVASNVATGAYMYGTGVPEIVANALEDVFANSISSNAGDGPQIKVRRLVGMQQQEMPPSHATTSEMRRLITIALVLANAAGVVLYLRNASISWAIPEEAGLSPGIAGPSFVWALGALPIAVLFAAINAVWLYIADRKTLGKAYICVSGAAWLIAIGYDLTHY